MAVHVAAVGTRQSMSYEGANEVVDTLVTKIETKFTLFTVNEIVKSGSLGHGTAVPSKYDVDLVVYSEDIDPGEVLAEGDNPFKKWLSQLKNFLQKEYGGDFVVEKEGIHSLQFRFRNNIDVDLLVSPFWGQHEPTQLYRFLKTIPRDQRDRFTISACKWQKEFFVDYVPNKVKEYIKKAKAWRNREWPEGRPVVGKPSSFLMSLLVMAAYERDPGNIKEALIELVSDGRPDICWDNNYQKRHVSGLLPSRPRIVDPGNPANNVWESGFKTARDGKISNYGPGDGDSSVLRSKIHTIEL